MAKYLITYLTGTFHEQTVDHICLNNDKIPLETLKLTPAIPTEPVNDYPRLPEDDETRKNRIEQDLESVNKQNAKIKLRNEWLENFRNGLKNKYFQCLNATDEELKLMVDSLSIGIYIIVMQHDVIRDDGFMMAERLKQSNPKYVSKVAIDIVKGGWHGLFNYNFTVKNKETDLVVTSWCNDVQEMIRTKEINQQKIDNSKIICEFQKFGSL